MVIINLKLLLIYVSLPSLKKQLNVHFPHFLLSAFLHSNTMLISGNIALCQNFPWHHNAGLFSHNAALFSYNARLLK